MNARNALRLVAGLLFASLALTSSAQALRALDGFTNQSLGANDDDVMGGVEIGFSANFFGNSYTQLYLSNNGNLQFNFADPAPSPYDLTGSTGNPIIAPFFADVDTREPGNPVSFGTGTLGGHKAFAANWVGVDAYDHLGVFNTFQVVLIERSDVSAGDFDIEFNYTMISWEAGDFSGGNETGLGGLSARAGYNSGTDHYFELTGSGVNGAFLDSNEISGLIYNKFGTPFDGENLAGRYDFQVRNASVVGFKAVPEPSTYGLIGSAFLCGLVALRRRSRGGRSA